MHIFISSFVEGVETCTKFNIYQHNDHIAVEVQSSDTPMSSSSKKGYSTKCIIDTGEKKINISVFLISLLSFP